MNVFRFIADFLHLLAFVIIIYKLFKTKSCKGFSAKTQEIYLLVFCTRYLDLFIYFISYYNTIMKILFISITIFILYLMHFSKQLSTTYNREKEDLFPHAFLLPFALIMTVLSTRSVDWWDLIWGFSLWLEAVAVLPQIYVIQINNGVESYTAHYLAALGSYRLFYIFNWIYIYIQDKKITWISVFSGTLQVILYLDFFYIYLKYVKKKIISELPVDMAEIKSLKKEDKDENKELTPEEK